MKNYSAILIALFVISTLSDVSCLVPTTVKPCSQQYQRCALNEDCCTQNCQPVNSTTSVCFEPLPIDLAGRPLQMIYSVCSYVAPENETLSENEYIRFGLNAAHSRLPTGNFYNITHNGTTITVQINDLLPRGNTTLELSKEAAEALNITGIATCKIEDGPEADVLDLLYLAHVMFITIAVFGILSTI